MQGCLDPVQRGPLVLEKDRDLPAHLQGEPTAGEILSRCAQAILFTRRDVGRVDLVELETVPFLLVGQFREANLAGRQLPGRIGPSRARGDVKFAPVRACA